MKFQFLIGTLETFQSLLAPFSPQLVSIPHRYARNHCLLNPLVSVFVVSIPHRYAENGFKLPKCRRRSLAFQFLIGTLKTALSIPVVVYCLLFQFLIGTLKTHAVSPDWTPSAEFQFLIGTLKTLS